MKELVKICKNGTKVWRVPTACDRCGGTGTYGWGAVINGAPQYAGTCYKCGGSGVMYRNEYERTPEADELLKAKAEKKAEAKRQRIAEAQARRAEAEAKRAEELQKRKEKQAEEASRSQYVGEVGDRITVRIVHHKSFSYESTFGFRPQTMSIHIMKDADGNVYKWNTANPLGYEQESNDPHVSDWHSIDEDEAFEVTGTVKDHTEYKGTKQTVLTRCKTKAA